MESTQQSHGVSAGNMLGRGLRYPLSRGPDWIGTGFMEVLMSSKTLLWSTRILYLTKFRFEYTT